MNLNILIPLIIYISIILGIAFYTYIQRQKNQDFLTEYYIGNRTMNGFVLAFTTAATYASAGSFIGGPGAAYKYGLGWVLLAMIQVPVVWLALGVLGKKFAMLARESNAITLNDMLKHIYKNNYVVWISCIALIISLFAATTAQFIGGARLLESSINISYNQALLIFSITIGIYIFIGGFKAIVLTDTIQGLIMVIGSILLLFATIYHIGGIDLAMNKLASIDPNLITPHGADNFLSLQFMLSFWVLVCFGIIALPPTAVRCMSYKNSRALHTGMLIGTIITSLLMFCMHLSGSLARVILPNIQIPDQIIPILMTTVLSPMIVGLFLAAPMSAIMSSIDASILQSSATLIKDLYLAIKPEEKNKIKKIKWLTRFSTLLLMVLLVFASMNPPDMLIWLSLQAIGALEVTFLWVIILGLYWKKANSWGAIASMLTGLTSYLALNIYNIQLFSFSPVVISLILGLIAFVIINHCKPTTF